ncbi:hypothetical protein EG68_04320 [Paragonimus skrjabini miyazakii]|uniref:Uncharacterized protein n=1 Tax=Paragonimus skrjabini miyazakii TaxID=59628 RepID=A0A8S9YVW1_9TREM|nr:hypothetical protein EG68_04320 [Paragonimus skrjabini miyazakii]
MFLRQRIVSDRRPRQYFKSLRRSKLRPTADGLKRIAESQLQTLHPEIMNLQVAHSLSLPAVDQLRLFCRIKFYNYCRQTTAYVTMRQMKKNTLSLSIKENLFNLDNYVRNFSKVNPKGNAISRVEVQQPPTEESSG